MGAAPGEESVEVRASELPLEWSWELPGTAIARSDTGGVPLVTSRQRIPCRIGLIEPDRLDQPEEVTPALEPSTD